MAWSAPTSQSASGYQVTSLNLTAPVGMQAGDVMVLFIISMARDASLENVNLDFDNTQFLIDNPLWSTADRSTGYITAGGPAGQLLRFDVEHKTKVAVAGDLGHTLVCTWLNATNAIVLWGVLRSDAANIVMENAGTCSDNSDVTPGFHIAYPTDTAHLSSLIPGDGGNPNAVAANLAVYARPTSAETGGGWLGDVTLPSGFSSLVQTAVTGAGGIDRILRAQLSWISVASAVNTACAFDVNGDAGNSPEAVAGFQNDFFVAYEAAPITPDAAKSVPKLRHFTVKALPYQLDTGLLKELF